MSQVEVPITLTSVPSADPAADRAVVHVELADGDRNAGRQPELAPPIPAQSDAGRLGGVVGFP